MPKTPFHELYTDVTHLKGEDKKPLCRTSAPKPKICKKGDEPTCRACRKRAKRALFVPEKE